MAQKSRKTKENSTGFSDLVIDINKSTKKYMGTIRQKKRQIKKHKKKYIPYDYDYVFDELLEKDVMNPILMENIIHNRLEVVYATKEIISGNQFEVEIFPEFIHAKDVNTIKPKKDNRKAQNNLNDKNARKQLERIIQANFTLGDIWITLTYPPGEEPKDFDEATKNMQNFIKRVNYRREKLGLRKARYIYITEHNPEGTVRWHHHLIMDGDMDRNLVEEAWNKKSRNETRKLVPDEYGLVGMAIYVTKQKDRKKGQKRWSGSKGLINPKGKKNHYKFKNKDVRKMVNDQNIIADEMKKRYPQYIFTEAQVYHNSFNGYWYIYARMRR